MQNQHTATDSSHSATKSAVMPSLPAAFLPVCTIALLLAGCQYQTVEVQITQPPPAVCAAAAAKTKSQTSPTGQTGPTGQTSPTIRITVSQDKPVEVSPGRELSPARSAQLRDNTVPVSGTGL